MDFVRQRARKTGGKQGLGIPTIKNYVRVNVMMNGADMLKGVFVLLFLPVLLCAQEWRVVPSGVWSHLKDVQFVNKKVGWAVGDDSTMIKTTDSGNTWFQLFPPVGGNIEALSFTDEQNGWIVAVGITKWGDIYHTTDGGVTWDSAGHHKAAQDIQFINKDTGWVIGYNGKVFRTTNGGSDWIDKSSGLIGVFTSCSFIDGMEGWVAGAYDYHDNFDDEVIYYTSDGGETWVQQDAQNRYGPLNKIHALRNGICFAYGWGKGIRSTNRGKTWEGMGPGNQATALFALDEEHIYVSRNNGSETIMLESNDTGKTWSEMDVQSPQFTKGIYFVDTTFGYAVGYGGKIWRYHNPSVGIVEHQESNISPAGNVLYPNPAGTVSGNGVHVTILGEQSRYIGQQFSLFSVLGNLVDQSQYTVSHSTGGITLDVSRLPSGVYYYVNHSEPGMKKIIVMNK